MPTWQVQYTRINYTRVNEVSMIKNRKYCSFELILGSIFVLAFDFEK